MKGIGIAFVAGLLGTLIGSLAAQAPDEAVRPGSEVDRFLYEGEIVSLVFEGVGERESADRGVVRVYPDWVLDVEQRRFIARERVLELQFRDAPGADAPARDFGDDPKPARPGRPDTFREDN